MKKILPNDVLGLISSARQYKGASIDDSFFLPNSFVNTMQLVLRDYSIPQDLEGDIPDNVREHLWAIIRETVGELD